MDRLDLFILAVLHKFDADSYNVAMSIDEVMEEASDVARISVYKHMKMLLKNDLVALGPKDRRAECFFITLKGKECLLGKEAVQNAEK